MSSEVFNDHFAVAEVQLTAKIGAKDRKEMMLALDEVYNRVVKGVPFSGNYNCHVEIVGPEGMFDVSGYIVTEA